MSAPPSTSHHHHLSTTRVSSQFSRHYTIPDTLPISSVCRNALHLARTKISTEHLYANTSTTILILHIPFLYLGHLYAGMDRVARIRDMEEGKLHDVAYGTWS